MTREDHGRWLDQLSEYLDGGLSSEEARALDDHLAGCGSCREALAGLRDVVARAHELGPVEPDRDLWPGIAGAIGAPPRREASDVIALPVAARRRGPAGVYLTVPQLAAAAVALVIFSGAATWWAGAGVPLRGEAPAGTQEPAAAFVADAPAPSPELARELAGLEAALEAARAGLDPNTVRIVEKNLAVIQRAIDESLLALEMDPGNPFLHEHLERAYREKADFLREATALAAWEG